MRCDREIAAEEINFIYVLEVFFAVFPSAPNTPIAFAFRRKYQANSFRHASVFIRRMSQVPFGAVK